MIKRSFGFKIVGSLLGRNWYGLECQKDVNFSFHNDVTRRNQPFRHYCEDLRDAVLHVTNDGDFQGCDLSADSVLVVIMEKWRELDSGDWQRHSVTERGFDLSLFPSVADCMSENYPVYFED